MTPLNESRSPLVSESFTNLPVSAQLLAEVSCVLWYSGSRILCNFDMPICKLKCSYLQCSTDCFQIGAKSSSADPLHCPSHGVGAGTRPSPERQTLVGE